MAFHVGDPRNDSFLGILELIGRYDSVIGNHLACSCLSTNYLLILRFDFIAEEISTEIMSSLNTSVVVEFHRDPSLISQESVNVMFIVVNIFLFGIISLIGMVNNVINMVIFGTHLLKDSITVGLFTLAFTDFSLTILQLTMSCIYLTSVLCPRSPVDLWALAFIFFNWAAFAEYLISSWITSMISLERCLCVVSPFKVKKIFTRGRCALVVVIIYFLIIVTIFMAFIVNKMEWIPINTLYMNASLVVVQQSWYYTVAITKSTIEVEAAIDITAGLFLSITSQVLLFVCSVWMTVSLKNSSKIRTEKTSCDKRVEVSQSKLTTQEIRLIRMILFLAVVKSASSLPRLSATIFYHIFPEMYFDEHKYFATVVWTAVMISSKIFFLSNGLGYYFLSSSYRSKFRNLFLVHDIPSLKAK
ncbi:hypothetical protein Btru_051603 [Bulinus truncatus]|nr:hypothetical protein Btru_051603 [Bulinus truncatus]